MNDFSPISDVDKQQLLTQLYEQFDDIMFILDKNLRYLSVNKAHEVMIGYQEKFLLGRPLGIFDAKFLSTEEIELLADITSSLHNTGFYQREFSMEARHGNILDCYMICRKICVNDTDYYLGNIRDISPIVKNKKRLVRLLNFDHLTGLPNSNIFLKQATQLLMSSKKQLVVVRINIDRYRLLTSPLIPDDVNSLIKEFAARVNKLSLTNLRCFSHFHADDFALLFEFNNADMVHKQLDKLTTMSERCFSLNGNTIYLHISVGVSYCPKNGCQTSELLTKAEKALYYVKQHGGNNVCWYHDGLNNVIDDSLLLEAELRTAIKDCQFVPHYQPKIELTTGAITGFEALVRWQHPTRGLLKPAKFIEAILRYKLSFELFQQMAIQITEQLVIWQAMGFTQHICINADAAEFSHPDFFDFVSGLFTENFIHPQQLHIEVTESSLMIRHNSIKQQLSALKKLGICLALDDFGTGYASLSYLQEYPFDFIKIDRSFISKITADRTQQAIVQAILDLAVALDMSTIAEGIETVEQRDLLLKMGCNYGQGYWFGHPVPADSATKMLSQAPSDRPVSL
jgi:diguanylate cyclase (GGDEF)-like protein/PAS domain S-box-containing protein